MIICPKCGAKDSEVDFVGAFCINCYEFRIKVPKLVLIKQCKKCERMWSFREWRPFNKKRIEEMVASKFRGDFEKIDYYLDSGTAVMYYNVDGKIHMIHRRFEPKFEIMLCPDCSRKSGGYFEAIIQLRGNKKRIEKYANILYNVLSEKTYLTKTLEKKEGIDLYIGNAKAVFEILKELGFKYKISRKLFTQRQGKRLYRTTFAVRF